MSDSCIFCRIMRGESPAREVYSDDEIYAFHDVNPVAPTHVLIIPRRHIPKISDIETSEEGLVGRMFLRGNEIAAREGLAPDGYRYVFNCGMAAAQSVYHVHLHLLGGRSFTWPPG
jgi:histidine triad (HIT) family protein